MRSYILSILFILFISCNEKSTVNKLNDSQEKELIKSTLTDMWNAIEKGDIDRYASYIHEDFTQFGEYDSVLRSGKAAEIKGIKDWIDSSTAIHTEMKEPKVTLIGNTAFYHLLLVRFWNNK